MVLKGIVTLSLLMTCSTATAEPVGRWWSGGGMGMIEWGFTRNDSNKLLFSCDPYERTMGLILIVGGRSPQPGSVVKFNVNGQTIHWRADREGSLRTGSMVEYSYYYALLNEIRLGSTITASFDGLAITIPLKGSAKALAAEPDSPCLPGL